MTIRLLRRTSLALALLVLALGWPAPAARAGSLCVNHGGTGGCFGTVAAALVAAADSDTILIAGGAPYLEHLTIAKSLSLIGDDPATTILDGGASGQVIRVNTAVSVTLTNLTIRNGLSSNDQTTDDQWGGGIRNISGHLTLNNVIVTGNRTGAGLYHGGNGGGIFNAGVMILNNSLVSHNSTGSPAGSQGGNGGFGGGIYSAIGALIISYSTISDNTTGAGDFGPHGGGQGGSGGGIRSIGPVTIDHSTIRGNTTGNGGEGAPGGHAGDGGGLATGSSAVTINASTFSGNQTGTGAFFDGRSGSGAGAFLFVDVGQPGQLVSINTSTFSGNATGLGQVTSTGGDGGGLAISGPITATLVNDTFAYNDVDPGQSGGGIASLFSNVEIENSLLAHNVAGDDPNNPHDCSGALTSLGYNVMVEPDCNVSPTPIGTVGDQFFVRGSIVDPLADNGGPTQTNALPLGSLAIDAGDNHACPPADQRGFARPAFGGTALRCDVGAYELYRFGVNLPAVVRGP